MSTDLVVQLGAKLDQFAADMDQAGNIADSAISRIESAFSSLNPGLGGFANFGTAVTGAIASVTALLGVLQHVNSELADIAKNATYVGVSTDRFQQIKFGATQGGVSSSSAETDLKHVADLLADAKNNENSLTKLLDANNIKYKDRNGTVINLNQLLTAAASLLGRFDSIPEKTKAAQMLGLSEAWVEALKGGPQAFEKIAASANEAGAVIDRATIAKAQNFDEAWKKSTDRLGYQFKAVAADIGSYLDDLIDRARRFVEGLNLANNVKAGSGQTLFDVYADSLAILAKNAEGAPQDLEQLNRVLEHYKSLSADKQDPALIAGLEEMRDKARAAAEQLAAVAKLASGLSFPEGVPTPAARPAAADDKTGTGVLPKRKTGSDARDQFEIGVDQITKRTATLNADTAATFQNNAVQAQFRAEFQLLTAILRDHGEVTQAQIDKYEKLRQTMSAQQALEAAGITLTKEHSAAFLASSQNIATATSAYDRARESLDKINSASQQVGSALSTAFGDAIFESKNLNDVLNNLLKTLGKGGINSIFASIFNAPSSGGLSPFASILKGIIPGFAEGTDSAPGGMAWVGENGKELVNLPRGAQVVPNAIAARGGGINIAPVYQIDATGADQAAIARLERTVTALNASLERRAVSAMAQHQARAG